MNPTLDVMLPVPCVVRRVVHETHDTFSLMMRGEGERPRFLPGQFNMLYAFGTGEVPVSISGDAVKGEEWVHTIRKVGSVTQALSRVRAGTKVGLRGPFGTAWPIDEARGKDLVLVAGGIGLAPLRPVIYDVLSRRSEFGHVALVYGARGPSDVLYTRELERWRSRFDLGVHVTVDRASGDWRGSVGVVTTLLSRLELNATKTIAMLCGPEVMMRFSIRELQKQHVGVDRIFVSMERNMKCAVGLCGHCQLGPIFICKDGPVFRADRIASMLTIREL